MITSPFLLKKGVLGIHKLKDGVCRYSSRKDCASKRKSKQIWNYSQLSKWLALNIQSRAGSHKPRTTFSNLCFSEGRGMNFVVDGCPLRQLRLCKHSPWVEQYLVKTCHWYQRHNDGGQRAVRHRRVTSIPRYQKRNFRKCSFAAAKAIITNRASPGTFSNLKCIPIWWHQQPLWRLMKPDNKYCPGRNIYSEGCMIHTREI